MSDERQGEPGAYDREGSAARADDAAAAAPVRMTARDLARRQELLIDEALKETFPASDPVSFALVQSPSRHELLDEALQETFPASDPVSVAPAQPPAR